MKRIGRLTVTAVLTALAMIFQIYSPVFAESSAETDGVAFCDWSGTITGAKTEGWTAPNNQNINDTRSAISVTDGALTYDTDGMTYNCQHLQVEMTMNAQTAAAAIAAAKASDNMLRVTFKVTRVDSSYGPSSVKFKMYCFANGDWQNGPTLIDGSYSMKAGEEKTFYINVDLLGDIVPDTIAINAMNYDSGITAINYTVSSVMAGGESATYSTSDSSDRFATADYEDYGDLINHRLLGDLNTDEAVNAADLLLSKKLVAKYNIKSEIDSAAADVYEDGAVNTKDIYVIKQILEEKRNAVHRPVTTDGYTNYNAYHPVNKNGNYMINGQEYEQVFYDDFEGSTLNRRNWEIGPQQERQNGNVWRNDMVSLNGKGDLVLSNAVDEDNPDRCKSGAVRSRDRFYNSYGYYEVRCLLQQYSTGFWGSFWIMPDSIDSGIDGGADGTEIDIFESAYLMSDKVQQGIHFDGYGSRHKTIGQATYVDNVYYGYHTFALSWEPDQYRFYVDGKLTYTLREGQRMSGGATVSISEVESYLKLSVEAGTWAGTFKPESTPHNIDGITVDYVKVFKPIQ